MQESVTDTYRAHLGLLWDTPLGAAAAQRMTSPPPAPAAQPAVAPDAAPAPDPAPEQPDATPEQARAQGAEAARNGILLTANPYPARSAARAAWDEGWCSETGTTGADIPPDLTPPPAEPEAES